MYTVSPFNIKRINIHAEHLQNVLKKKKEGKRKDSW